MRAPSLLLLAVALAAADPAADLRAAHAARVAVENEERGWAQDRERAQAAIDALVAQAADDRAATAELTARSAEVRAAAAAQRAAAPLHARLDPLLEQIAAALADLRKRAFPGTVPTTDGPSAADVLEAAERAEAQVAASIERVRLDGSELTVRVLRAGLRRGWWMSLDGKAAGSVTVADGALVCVRAADPGVIRSLFAQFDGREPPRWLLVGTP